MVTIREEARRDIAARDALLDMAYGASRFAKTSERLREGRMPVDGLSLVAVDDGKIHRHGPALACHRRSGTRGFAAGAARGRSGTSQPRHRHRAGAPRHRARG